MGFTLPFTRLAFKHLRWLSYQRLGPPTTLTIWVSTLYVRLTDSLECQDAILTWILTKLYNEAPPRNPVKLRPDHEAPPWTPTSRGHGITSWPWGTTTKPSWNYVLTNEAPPWDLTYRFMELRPKPYQNHVSPTKYKIVMHTNSMPTFITNHPFMFHTKIIPNSSISAHKPFNTCKITQFML